MARTYECPKCGESMSNHSLKQSMVIHCRKPANTACLEMLSGSSDLRRMEWARLASEDECVTNKFCPFCGEDLGTSGDMVRHFQSPGNAECLQYAENSGDDRLIEIFEQVTTEVPTRTCPCCHKQFPRSNFGHKFQNRIKATKNIACLNFARNFTDPLVFKCYNKVSQ